MLAEAQSRGYIGPGPILPHVQRALDLGAAVSACSAYSAYSAYYAYSACYAYDRPPKRAIDLGSGGGLPGLPLALAWPATEWVLLDGSTTKAAFLAGVVEDLGLTSRVSVVASRAEVAGRGALRATMDVAVARSFAAPGTTAECAAPFLVQGGLLVVSEPPGCRPGRWDSAGLAALGLAIGPCRSTPTSFQVLHQEVLCPQRFPRRVGIPAKRPLF